jgi:hypothetical protein
VVIRFFDELMTARADVATMVLETARWAGRAVGARAPGIGVLVSDARAGHVAGAWPEDAVLTLRRHGITVALGPDDTPDDLAILDRLAFAVRLRLDQDSGTLSVRTRADAVAALVDPTTDTAVRDWDRRHTTVLLCTDLRGPGTCDVPRGVQVGMSGMRVVTDGPAALTRNGRPACRSGPAARVLWRRRDIRARA